MLVKGDLGLSLVVVKLVVRLSVFKGYNGYPWDKKVLINVKMRPFCS